MEKQLKIDIIADTSKFEWALEKMKKSAKESHAVLKSIWDTWDTSWLDKIKSKIDKVSSDAKSAKNDVKQIWSAVDTSWIEKFNSKITSAQSDVKKLDWLTSAKRELYLKIDQYEQQIWRARNDLKRLDSETSQAQELRLNIKEFTTGLNQARKELTNFVNTWDKQLSSLQQKFDKLWTWIKTGLAWWVAAVGGVSKATDVVLSTEELQRRLVTEWWLSAKEARTYSAQVDASAARAWIPKEEYRQAYISLVQQWAITPSQVESSKISTAAVAWTKKYDIEEFTRWSKILQNVFGWDLGTIQKQVLWTVSMKWLLDKEKDIPNLLAEYAPLLKERGFTLWETLNVAKVASQQGTFNLDKPFDLLKEQWAKFSDIFTRWNEWQLKTLNQVFGQEFWTLRNQYLKWEVSTKDVWSILAGKTEGLSKANKLKLLLDVFGTQAEDLWFSTTKALLESPKWLDSKKLTDDLRKAWESQLEQVKDVSTWTLSNVLDRIAAWAWTLVQWARTGITTWLNSASWSVKNAFWVDLWTVSTWSTPYNVSVTNNYNYLTTTDHKTLMEKAREQQKLTSK